MSGQALHVWLESENRAFHFQPADFDPLRKSFPSLELVHHATRSSLLEALPAAELIATWHFETDWYARAPRLRALFTPAAGKDWVAEDPARRVATHYGTFHGPMIAQSLLGLMLHFNRRIPRMLENAQRRAWDRNLQFPSRLLRNQSVLLIGYGNIARACARLLRALEVEVVGCQRSPGEDRDAETGARLCKPAALPEELARADHVVLLLPGGDETRGFLDRERLQSMKRGAYLYNFGRGTTVRESDVLWALEAGILGGAGLDVTEPEPLPASSPLWSHPQVLVLPHSSCVYQEYRALHVAELANWLRGHL